MIENSNNLSQQERNLLQLNPSFTNLRVNELRCNGKLGLHESKFTGKLGVVR